MGIKSFYVKNQGSLITHLPENRAIPATRGTATPGSKEIYLDYPGIISSLPPKKPHCPKSCTQQFHLTLLNFVAGFLTAVTVKIIVSNPACRKLASTPLLEKLKSPRKY
uniref:Uncharacterized protein n=1 Tax=Micrurus spixii TaxID=129469 RepID=A0A2D4LN15_9SAUR